MRLRMQKTRRMKELRLKLSLRRQRQQCSSHNTVEHGLYWAGDLHQDYDRVNSLVVPDCSFIISMDQEALERGQNLTSM